MRATRHRNEDYRLTTAEIFFHSTETPDTLQSLIWQDYDTAPEYPELRKFLTYWSRHIDSIVHSVYVAASERQAQGGSEKGFMPSSSVH